MPPKKRTHPTPIRYKADEVLEALLQDPDPAIRPVASLLPLPFRA